ncbi:MAG: SDR family NAD(P)-dependent oxidoreductase [Planctomycetota bacterium]|jgi:NAD(P)-dependent dehydrogenase (short-subunit alcohol dehydrogenase family)
MPELALVTGGETGIGRAIVAALRKEGFEVRTASRRSGHDLTDPAAVDRLVKSLPRLDVLVNNAGLAEAAPLAKSTDEFWNRHFELNVTAPFRLCRSALALLRQAPHGRIVNVVSVAGLRGAPYIAAYAASKHALLGLTRVLAAELTDVSVHAVCPGFADTELTDRSIRQIMAATGKTDEEARAALAAQNSGGRLIRPEEVAAAVLELVSATDTGREIVLE